MAAQSTEVLKMLQEMAVKEVDLAKEALAKALKSLDEANSKEALLMDYKQGYVGNLNKSLEMGLNVKAYQNYQNFLYKLDQAIQGQLDIVSMAKAQVQIQRELLQESQRKKLSYDVLLDRADKRVLKAEQKRDQKMMDEFAMRMSRTKH
jgi:flagellar FliJ protein